MTPLTPEQRKQQEDAYLSGAKKWPVSFSEWEQAAETTLERKAFDYVATGAGEESTVRANRSAFERWRLRPRMLSGNEERDLSIEILNTKARYPFFLAPIGVQGILHPEGDVASAGAAATTGVPFVTSSCGSFSLEQIADALGPTPRWFQLYWVTDREVTASFVKRAEAAGYEAIAVTVDTLTLGYRDRDIRNDGYLPFLFGDGIGQFTSDPVFRTRLPKEGADDPATQGLTMVSMFPNLALNWDDFAWLRDQTSLPILIKGILTAEDARKAMEIGIDGIMVSNHGGRQVDGAISALDALVEVRDAVGPGPVVVMDSGIRRASDMLKALALGADAVLLGRPYVYALAAAGQAGVEQLLRSMITELESTFALLGCSRVSDLDRSYVRRM